MYIVKYDNAEIAKFNNEREAHDLIWSGFYTKTLAPQVRTVEDDLGIVEYFDNHNDYERPYVIQRKAEYLGDKDGVPQWGKSFYTTSKDDIIVDRNFNPYCDDIRYESRVSDEIDSFHDGCNRLEEIDGVLYEVSGRGDTMIRIRKKSYLSFEEALKSFQG